MFKISNFYLVGAIIILALMTSGCATTPTKFAIEQVATLKPPEIKFGAFEKIYYRSTGINSALASHSANQKALARIDEHLLSRVLQIFPSLTVIEANEQLDGLDKNSLLIEPFVDDIRFIGETARTWAFVGGGGLARVLAGASYVNLSVTFTDLSQDKIIASPTFYQRVGAWAGACYEIGYRVNAMLTMVGDLASKYIRLHLTEATGEDPSSREQPSDEKDAKNKKESDDVIDADYKPTDALRSTTQKEKPYSGHVYASNYSRSFHRRNCVELTGKEEEIIVFKSKEHAMRDGALPCKTCKP
jgi:hypothetical protein